eukprot:3934073-Rhodomonas_salina.1
MANGAALLNQLLKRREAPDETLNAVTSLIHKQGGASILGAPPAPPARMVAPTRQQDEWVTGPDGRRRRVRAPGYSGSEATRDAYDDENGQRIAAPLEDSAAFSLEIPADSSNGIEQANRPAAAASLATDSIKEVGEPHTPKTEGAAMVQSTSVEAEAAGWKLVRQHNDEDACWIVIGSRVLDATKYLGHHPGGRLVIKKLAGQDATQAYIAARHSHAADLKLYDYEIGALTDLKRLKSAAKEAARFKERLQTLAQYLN